jgi:hypothetical protein
MPVTKIKKDIGKTPKEIRMNERISAAKTKKQKNFFNFVQRAIRRKIKIKQEEHPFFNAFCCEPDEENLSPIKVKLDKNGEREKKKEFDWKKFVTKKFKPVKICGKSVFYLKEGELNDKLKDEGYKWVCHNNKASYIIIPEIYGLVDNSEKLI